jgi:hypothetical protein
MELPTSRVSKQLTWATAAVAAAEGVVAQAQAPVVEGVAKRARAVEGVVAQAQAPAVEGVAERARAVEGVAERARAPAVEGVAEQAWAVEGVVAGRWAVTGAAEGWSHLTSVYVAPGLAAKSSAAAPATMGVAMLVPLRYS